MTAFGRQLTFANGRFRPLADIQSNPRMQLGKLTQAPNRPLKRDNSSARSSVLAGGFEPLRFMPKAKQVALGLVSTKTPSLEREDELMKRIESASKFVPLDQLALSPQCGFASSIKGNPLTQADQEAKLRRIVEVAEKAWR
jgi:methionine synthase II (cobalamin-independent)